MQGASGFGKHYYLSAWREMLRAFLGWSDEQVMEWAQAGAKWTALDDPQNMIYHESPFYWIKHLLIPESLLHQLSPPRVSKLESRIWASLQDEERYMFPLGTDWEPYKAKINAILAEYGTRLPGM